MHDGMVGTKAARVLIVLAALLWGLNWAATRILLEIIPPFTIRALAVALGALVLFAAAALHRDRLNIPRGERTKVAISAVLNVTAFNLCSVYAQVFGSTSRAVVIAYTMPIWAILLGKFVLKETVSPARVVAVGLCIIGLGLVLLPSLLSGLSMGALFALASAGSWAAGTVYQKAANLTVPLLTSTAWQLLLSAVVLSAGMFAMDGVPHLTALGKSGVALLVYSGVFALGLGYLAWFLALAKLRTGTAAIGTLLAPVVGVVASMLVNGERPSLADGIGFILIFLAAGTVLLEPANPKRNPAGLGRSKGFR